MAAPQTVYRYKGIAMAVLVIALWLANLLAALCLPVKVFGLPAVVLVLLQTHLFTGLFITAHDAMHGSLAPRNPRINNAIGGVCTFLYAFFPYGQLKREHHRHHRHVHTANDPDYHGGGFWAWYFHFVKHYTGWRQVLGYAIAFNILKIWIPVPRLLVFWILPALLSTLQLFHFGTYAPHKGRHGNKHQSRSQAKNHWAAFFSCYFFGYHYEHHDLPHIPWWRLWRVKE